MRRLAPLFALALAILIGGVGASYWYRKQRQTAETPAPPKPLSNELSAKAAEWEWSYTTAGRRVIEVRAKDFVQIKEPNRFDLEGVQLKIFQPDGLLFDKVQSAKAQFFPAEGRLFSEGEVTIEMGFPVDGSAPGRLIQVKSSGVAFENRTGRADTDRSAQFALDVGEGTADGAAYDPQTKELRLKSNVALIWRGSRPGAPPMRIEAAEAIYKETEGKVFLMGSTRFARGTLAMTAGPAVITLDKGNIRMVETTNASGIDKLPDRSVEFAGEQLQLMFRDKGEIEKILANPNARLASTTKTSKTLVRSNWMDLQFAPSPDGSVLSKAFGNGGAVAESIPIGSPGVPPGETRVLKSESIELQMKSGGRDIDEVRTHAKGTLEFLPNRAGQPKRRLDAERMTIKYAANNQIETFRAVKASTRTERPSAARKPLPPQLTWSEDMSAQFDPKTGEMTRLEQWTAFRFEEGDRRAIADRATILQPQSQILLTGGARVWDATGSTDADAIAIDDRANTTVATGKVRSVRSGAATAKADAPSDTMRATAARMSTEANNTRIRYAGNAILWQGDNRLEGETVDIDRTASTIHAVGKITSHLHDRKTGITTLVKADDLNYSDKEKLAVYTGNVVMTRPRMNVRSRKLRAYLGSEQSEEVATTLPDTGMEKAFAEGAVEIVQTDGQRTRLGVAEQADYEVNDGRVILEGGQPKLTETIPGAPPNITQGRRLTWFSANDRLIVDGAADKPAVSNLRRKKK